MIGKNAGSGLQRASERRRYDEFDGLVAQYCSRPAHLLLTELAQTRVVVKGIDATLRGCCVLGA